MNWQGSKLCETSSSSHLLLISNGSDVSQNALDLLMGGSLADVILQKATERSSDCLDVVLTQICIFTSSTRKERENRFDGERKRQNSCEDCERSSLTRSKGELCPAGTALQISSWTASCCPWWRWTCTGCDLHHDKHIKISAKVLEPQKPVRVNRAKGSGRIFSFVFFIGISEFWNPSSRLWEVQFFNEI